uniref:Uncharacterized protein n=1 Tax=Anguilla anguilla TaxID=7936 RepID=A0A0E9XIY1_ANGAN
MLYGSAKALLHHLLKEDRFPTMN